MNLTCGSGLVARGRDDTARAGRVRGGRKALACGGMGRARRLGRVGAASWAGRVWAPGDWAAGSWVGLRGFWVFWVWAPFSTPFPFLFYFLSFLFLIQTKFEFKFTFEFNPHSNKSMHQHECNNKNINLW